MTPEELEALRLAQEAAANNSMTQPYDLIGQQGQQETGMDTNPMLMGGLGLGGGFVASQTGGAPATSQVLSPFAQKVAAQDAANLAAQRAAFNPAIIGQNLPGGGVNPAVTGTPKLPLQTPSSVLGSNLPTGGVNPEVKGRVKTGVFNRPNIKSTTPLTPNKVLGGLNANPLSSIASNLLKGSAYTAAVTPNLIGDSTLTGAYNSAVAAGEDPATAAARLGTADTSIRGLDTSNREVDFMPDGTGVLNGVSLFTGGAETTGMNYADVVNADNARRAAAQAEAVADANPFVPPLDFAGEIQSAPETYSGLVENNPFTSMGGTSVEDNQYTMEREAGNVAPVAQTNEVAPGEGFMSRLVGRLGEQFTQPAPYTPQGGGAEAETAFGATPTQPTLFREGLSALSELNETPLTSPDSFQTEAPIVPAPASPIAALQSQAEPGSPQAFFEEYRSQGPLTPEQIARGEAEAARMGTTFDSETGFSREPFLQYQRGQAPQVNRPEYGYGGAAPMSIEETRARLGGRTLNEYLNAPNGTEGVYGLRTDPQGRMIPAGFETRADADRSYKDESAAREGRLAARMQQPGESITERDTRIARERTQSSQNVPTDVRQAMLTPEGRRTAKQINRLARWSGSTQGQEMGGVAGLEKSLQPVDAQKQQYDAMRVYKLGLEIDKMQQEKPSEYQESAAEVDEAIAAGSIKPEDRNKFILRDLGWQAKGGEDSSDLMSIIYGDGSKSGGEPVLVKTQEEYNNLAKGTRYTDEDGNIATKK